MVLPQVEVATPEGRATGARKFAEAYGKPIVLYIKHDHYMDVSLVKSLMSDGVVSAIKYAIVRDDPADDPYLRSLVDTVGPELIVSGIGEQPAITHMKQFGLAGFTSACSMPAGGLESSGRNPGTIHGLGRSTQCDPSDSCPTRSRLGCRNLSEWTPHATPELVGTHGT